MCTQVKSCLFVLCQQSDHVCVCSVTLLYSWPNHYHLKWGAVGLFGFPYTNEHMYSNCLHKVSKYPIFKFVFNSFLHYSSLFIKRGLFGFRLFMYVIQHWFICHPSDSTAFLEGAGWDRAQDCCVGTRNLHSSLTIVLMCRQYSE
jgi:hypothetical protein